MTAYVIATIRVTDPTRMKAYRAQVPATIAAFGGRYCVRGGQAELIEGGPIAERFVVLAFDTMERARAWYASPEYAPLKTLRRACGETTLVFVEGVEGGEGGAA